MDTAFLSIGTRPPSRIRMAYSADTVHGTRETLFCLLRKQHNKCVLLSLPLQTPQSIGVTMGVRSVGDEARVLRYSCGSNS